MTIRHRAGRAGSPLHAVAGHARLARECEPYQNGATHSTSLRASCGAPYLQTVHRGRGYSGYSKTLCSQNACDLPFVMQSSNRSPRIKHVSWGKLEVEGRAEPYKDAKLFPGGSREWNWRETGTGHLLGIQPADVQELLDHNAKIVVLSRGMKECLHVPRETLDFLKERDVAAHVLPTAEAVELYNKLAVKEPVGGLFHTTC
jgi:hypothetical protein